MVTGFQTLMLSSDIVYSGFLSKIQLFGFKYRTKPQAMDYDKQ